jgi:hypothetical protein
LSTCKDGLGTPRKNKTGEFYKCSNYDISTVLDEIAFRESQEMPALTLDEALEYRSKNTKSEDTSGKLSLENFFKFSARVTAQGVRNSLLNRVL